ncbi:MAG: SDR family NAD(P)-dependent oxidoreductase [Gammaproteobacteria bacterium]|nr:SDR family NAD(P)-dependent oxidoreductase [Gammaproteobacteria bacterium]
MPPHFLSSDNRVILISGANRGIGRVIAERLYDDGYTLSLGARKPESLEALAAGMDESRVLTHAFDARAARSAAAWVTSTCERFGRLDAIVNNAGVMYPFDVESGDESRLDEMWEVNTKAPWRLVRAAFPHLKQSGAGRVINIVSLSGKRVKSAGVTGYAMTKYALDALTHGIRYAGWEHGIRATAICPGFVATDMTAAVDAVPREKMIPPQAVAELVATVLTLPNSASVSELPINCVLEHTF